MNSRISRESSATRIFSEGILAYVLRPRRASGTPEAYHQTRQTQVRDGWGVLGTKVPLRFPKASKTLTTTGRGADCGGLRSHRSRVRRMSGCAARRGRQRIGQFLQGLQLFERCTQRLGLRRDERPGLAAGEGVEAGFELRERLAQFVAQPQHEFIALLLQGV